jgi:hypothetical protein
MAITGVQQIFPAVDQQTTAHFAQNVRAHRFQHPYPGARLLNWGLPRYLIVVLQKFGSLAMRRHTLRIEALRCKIAKWFQGKHVDTITRWFRELEEAGFVRRHYTPDPNHPKHQRLTVELIPLQELEARLQQSGEAWESETGEAGARDGQPSPSARCKDPHDPTKMSEYYTDLKVLSQTLPQRVSQHPTSTPNMVLMETKTPSTIRLTTSPTAPIQARAHECWEIAQTYQKNVWLWWTLLEHLGCDPKYRFALMAKLRRLPKAKFEQILADVEFFLRKKQSIQEVPRWLHGRIRNDVASAACPPDPQPAANPQTAQRQAERERQAQEQTHQTLERVRQQLAQRSQETLVEEPQHKKRAEPVKRWERSKLQELQKLLGKKKLSR